MVLSLVTWAHFISIIWIIIGSKTDATLLLGGLVQGFKISEVSKSASLSK
jgi:hypothetical protein